MSEDRPASGSAIPQAELEQLVTKWREEGSALQLNDPDRIAEKGKGLVECANELEELIEDEADTPPRAGIEVPSTGQLTHDIQQGGSLKNIGGGGARPSGNISAPAIVKAAFQELRKEPERKYRWECPECGEENEVDPSVVELCVEHWTCCEECGNRVAFDFSGEP